MLIKLLFFLFIDAHPFHILTDLATPAVMAFSLGFVAIFFALAAIALIPLIKFIRLWVTINKFEGPPAIPLLGNAHQLQGDPFGACPNF